MLSNMTGIRSFIAIAIKDELVLEKIQRIQQDLQRTRADLKIVVPQNIHFTLHFLGNIESHLMPQLQSIIQEIDISSFDAELTGIGCFRPSRPRIIWVGVLKGNENFVQLHGLLAKRLREQQFPVEQQKYSPHLTIARVRSGAQRAQLLHVLDQHANFEFGQIRVSTVALKKSTLTPRGPIYEDIEVKTLK